MFAQVSDLRARKIEFDDEEEAKELLKDASQMLVDEMPAAVSRAHPRTLTRIVCSMVKRSLDDPGPVPFGMETGQFGVGPFQQSWKRHNPSDSLYLTKADRRALRGGQRAFMITTGTDQEEP